MADKLKLALFGLHWYHNSQPLHLLGSLFRLLEWLSILSPSNTPIPPIIIGGHASSSYRRTIQSGNGWYGWGLDLGETANALAQLRDTAERYQRPSELGPLEISITPRGTIDVETARRYADLGVHRLVFLPTSMEGPAIDEMIKQVAETLLIISKCRF